MNENKALEELIKAERREYFRQWRAANPEKVRKHNANYWRNRAVKKLNEQQAEKEQQQETETCDTSEE